MSFPPTVLDDHATIDAILDGRRSFARFGDGEYRLVTGKGTKTQLADPALTVRLRQILLKPDPLVLVGILPLYGDDHPVAAPWSSRADTTQRYGSEKWARKYLAEPFTVVPR